MKRKFTIGILSVCAAAMACFGFAACNKKPSDKGDVGGGEQMPPTEEGVAVTDYMLDSERKFTGTLKDGKPEGEGMLEWVLTNCFYTGNFEDGQYSGEGKFEWRNDGNVFEGTFENNEPKEGKFTYANTMTYTGTFKNWQFNGTGVFDWNRYNPNGSLLDGGWLYEGEFKDGTIAGCVGKLTFVRSGNGPAVYWFEGEMSGFPEVKRDQVGKGFIRYPDNSTYEGEILYTAGGEWKRFGKGEQNFFSTTFTGASAGGKETDKIYCYEGTFDELATGWMSGNGIMYFCNADGTPTGYIKGTWKSLTRVGPYTAEWSDDILKEGWRNTSELEYLDAFMTLFNGYMEEYGNTDMTGKLLMIGDSQFSKECFPQAVTLFGAEYDTVNIAIGGTTSAWWRAQLDDLILGEPAYVLVHVGGNDIRTGASQEEAIADTKALMDELAVKYPHAELFYVSGIVGVFDYQENRAKKEIAINDALTTYAEESGKFAYIDVFATLYDKNKKSDYYEERYGYLQPDCFIDRLHLTSAWYDVWGAAIKRELNALLAVQG